MDKKDFLQRVRSLSKVTRVRITGLEKSNPEFDEEFKGAEQWLDAVGAERFDGVLASPKKGLHVEKGALPAQMLALASRGYGEAEVVGNQTGVDGEVRISTASDALGQNVKYRSLAELRKAFIRLLPEVAGAEDAPADRKSKTRRRRGT